MKKTVFSLFIFFLILSCNQENNNIISVAGTIQNGALKKIQLLSFGNENAPIILDTTTIDKNGKYQLKSLANGEELYAIIVDGANEIWFVNDTKEININADYNAYKKYEVQGSISSQKLHQFIIIYDSLLTIKKNVLANIDTLIKNKATDSTINIAKAEEKITSSLIKDYALTSINKTQSPALKYFYLFYAHKTKAIDENEGYKLITIACNEFPLNNQLNGLKSQLYEVVKSNPKLFLINEAAANFKYVDTSNVNISLATFKGKYLLIDFWESNCTNYRKQTAFEIETYKLYKDKKFEILGICFDTLKTTWQKSIKQDSLFWTQVRDTIGLKSEIAKKYFVASVPYNVLINPQGKIIATDIWKEELREKLKSLLQ